MNEHQIILDVLNQLDTWGQTVSKNNNQHHLKEFCDFIQNFVDPIHHIKEENFLFPAMIAMGFSGQHGPIAAMLYEHDEGRKLTQILATLAKKEIPWTPEDLSTACSTAQDFAALLGQHIHKENKVLYPMAQNRLLPDDLTRLSTQMQALSQSSERTKEYDRLTTLANKLISYQY